MSHLQNKSIIESILVEIEKIINSPENWDGDTPKTHIAQSFMSNQKNAFQQLCFYTKYKPTNLARLDVLNHEYFKWKTIFTAYTCPQKILNDLNENKLTKRLQKTLIQHFLGNQTCKEKQDNSTNISKLFYLKMTNSR